MEGVRLRRDGAAAPERLHLRSRGQGEVGHPNRGGTARGRAPLCRDVRRPPCQSSRLTPKTVAGEAESRQGYGAHEVVLMVDAAARFLLRSPTTTFCRCSVSSELMIG